MKYLNYLFIITTILFSSCKKDDEIKDTEQTVTVMMGADQINDVYYSFSDGVVSTVARDEWDIAFSVPLQTAAIRINEGAGVELYSVGDTNSWNAIDTSGFSERTSVYNDNSDWLAGAFNQYATGGFNFGWGTYDFDVSHTVWGDSIYVIKLTDGSFKKLFIRKRIGYTDTYVLRWADIDGSGEVNTSFSPAEYADTKHFIHYSLVSEQVVEAEPDKDTWDLLFTRYIAEVPAGPEITMLYTVMGVLTNQDVSTVKVTGVNPAEAHYSDAEDTFSDEADVIGWDWKEFDQVNLVYVLAENTSYFVKRSDETIYRIYFTEYGGQSDGSVTFKIKLVE
ncbi:MAG: hypothetical protein JW894_09410 [Bacteroidales bacterium]|nr:hypothetical protein [Bacteroidales bacterium]